MELRDYAHVLRKRWRLIALALLLALTAGSLLTLSASPQYSSTVTFFVSTPGEDTGAAYSGGLFSQQRVRSYADIVAGSATAQAVADEVDALEVADVAGRISAAPIPDTVLLETTATARSPETAQQIAQGLAAVFPGVVDALERQDGGSSPVRVSVVEQPQLASDPFSPRPVRNLALAAVLGLLLGTGAAVLRESLDTSIQGPDEVRDVLGLPTLGAIAFDADAGARPLIVHAEPHSARAEAFRQLRTNLQFVDVDTAPRSIVVTSSVPEEGKSSTVANLAIALSQAGVRVAVVDADLRRPRIAEYMGLEGAIGLTDVLVGRVALDDVLQPWGTDGLLVLPSGRTPPNPSELLGSRHMRELLGRLEQRVDLVLLDAPPLLPVTDAAVLSTFASGAMLVVRAGRTRKEHAARAVEALRGVDAHVYGAVLSMVAVKGPGAARYGYYGHAYGPDKPAVQPPRAAGALPQPVLPAASSVGSVAAPSVPVGSAPLADEPGAAALR